MLISLTLEVRASRMFVPYNKSTNIRLILKSFLKFFRKLLLQSLWMDVVKTATQVIDLILKGYALVQMLIKVRLMPIPYFM